MNTHLLKFVVEGHLKSVDICFVNFINSCSFLLIIFCLRIFNDVIKDNEWISFPVWLFPWIDWWINVLSKSCVMGITFFICQSATVINEYFHLKNEGRDSGLSNNVLLLISFIWCSSNLKTIWIFYWWKCKN